MKPKLRLAISGGRDYWDHYNIVAAINRVREKFDITIIHGDCPTGADRSARLYCESTGVPMEAYPADWKKYGKAAGPTRNQQMVDAGFHLLLAFPGGPGTRDMVARTSAAGIPVKLIRARVDNGEVAVALQPARKQDADPQGIQKPAAEAETGNAREGADAVADAA